MGGALLRAAASVLPPEQIAVSNRTASKAEKLAMETGTIAVTNSEIARESKFIFLGVKPGIMPGMLSDIASELSERKDRFVLVSMAAGLTTTDIHNMSGGDYPVIRIMPNTPVSVGSGMTSYTVNANVTDEDLNEFLHIMSGSGTLDRLDEKLIDAGCAVSGCGPAFVFMFIEAMADAGVRCGLSRKKSMEYAALTLKGSAELVLKSGEHPGALKDAVCSPGGATMEGILTLEANAFRSAVSEAVTAAYDKTVTMFKK